MLSLIIAKPTSAPVRASCTAHGWGIARCSSSASSKISSIELRYWSWPGPRCRPMTAARSPGLTMSRNSTVAIAASSRKVCLCKPCSRAAGGRLPARDAGLTDATWPGWIPEEALDMDVGKLLMKVSDDLSVRRAFGTAYEKDDMLIIPVALVTGGGGGGMGRPRHDDQAAGPGSPPGESPAGDDTTPRDPERTDAGGGFGGLVLPSGAYVVKDGQVRWVPAVDVTVVVLASLGLVRVLARTWGRSRRRRGGRS